MSLRGDEAGDAQVGGTWDERIALGGDFVGSVGEVFGDTVIANAMLDRPLHHATTGNIKGESYRLKEERRAGLLRRAAFPGRRTNP